MNTDELKVLTEFCQSLAGTAAYGRGQTILRRASSVRTKRGVVMVLDDANSLAYFIARTQSTTAAIREAKFKAAELMQMVAKHYSISA